MKILVVNNFGQYNHRIHRTLNYLNIPSEMIPNSLSIDEINEKEHVGMVLGGGPSMERTGNCLEYVRELNCPILGICLGHQIIAKAFEGEIGPAGIESYAKIEITIIDEDDIFKGFDKKMKVWASHKDEVKSLPADFKLLASSPICEIEAMKHKKKPIYGIQFHPEVYHTENGPLIFENFYQACIDLKNKSE